MKYIEVTDESRSLFYLWELFSPLPRLIHRWKEKVEKIGRFLLPFAVYSYIMLRVCFFSHNMLHFLDIRGAL